METCNFLKFFMNYERFLGKKTILIKKIPVRLMGYWKSLIIQKEIKNPSGKFLLVLAKNQLIFEGFWENFKIYLQTSDGNLQKFTNYKLQIKNYKIYKNTMENWFLAIFYPIFQDHCHFIQLPPLLAPLFSTASACAS